MIRLNKDSVRRLRLDPPLESRGVRGEQIVPDHMTFRPHELREPRVSVEVILLEGVFHTEQIMALDEVRNELDLLVRGQGAVPIGIRPVLVELRARAVARACRCLDVE